MVPLISCFGASNEMPQGDESQPEQLGEIARLVSRLANPTNAKAAELKDRAAEVWDTARVKLRDHNGEDGATSRAQIALA